jgi:uncharacterized protein
VAGAQRAADGATVAVRGTARVEAHPDVVVVHLSARGDADTRAKALTGAAARQQAVQQVFDAHAADLEATSFDQVWVAISYDRSRGRRPSGYTATVRATCRTRRFDGLGELLADLVAAADVAVDRLHWRVDDTNPAHAEVHAEAVAVAVRRAEGYARALGLQLGAVVRVSDPGVQADVPPRPFGAAAPAPAAARGGGAEPPPVLDVTPPTEWLFSAVELVFELATPPA